MPAPGPGAYDRPHFDDQDAADAYWERDLRIFEPSEEGQPHADPDAPLFVGNDADRTPTTEVPVTPMRDVVWPPGPPETREYHEALREVVRR